jgi:hypothetical protein
MTPAARSPRSIRRILLTCATTLTAVLAFATGVFAAAATTPPTVTAAAATGVTATTATLNAVVNPMGFDTSVYFQYRVEKARPTIAGVQRAISTPWLETPSVDVGAGTEEIAQSFDLAGLAPSTTYEYRLVATYAAGGYAYGDLMELTTPAAPVLVPPPVAAPASPIATTPVLITAAPVTVVAPPTRLSPVKLSLLRISNSKLCLTWTASKYATSYRLIIVRNGKLLARTFTAGAARKRVVAGPLFVPIRIQVFAVNGSNSLGSRMIVSPWPGRAH